MSLNFHNALPSATVSVVFSGLDTGCSPVWSKVGWWTALPGQTVTVYTGDVASVNRYWYYFAVADDSGDIIGTWAGPYPVVVPTPTSGGFRQCLSDRAIVSYPSGSHSWTFRAIRTTPSH